MTPQQRASWIVWPAGLAVIVATGILFAQSPNGIRVSSGAHGLVFADARNNRIAEEVWPGAFQNGETADQQRAYNAWARDLWTALPGGAGIPAESNVPGVRLVAQHPTGFDPFQDSFKVPASLEVTGVIDRHTLAIPVYQAGVDLARLWNEFYADVTRAQPGSGAGYASSPFVSSVYQRLRNPPAVTSDPYLFVARYWEIRTGVDRLVQLGGLLRNLDQRTASGVTTAADTERVWQVERLQALAAASPLVAEASRANRVYQLDDDAWRGRLDFITSFIPYESLTSSVVETLNTGEAEIRAHVYMAHVLASESSALVRGGRP